MKVKIYRSRAEGTATAPPSKSMAHRDIIAAALAQGTSKISNVAYSEDIKATIDCARELGATVVTEDDSVTVTGAFPYKSEGVRKFYCRESGSTLRFFMGIAMGLGGRNAFYGSEKLLSRPLGIYEDICKAMNPVALRNYEVYLMDGCSDGAKTVNQHLSVLSSFGRYLMKEGLIQVNPARTVSRPKVEKRLPEFFRESSMKEYFDKTDFYASEENTNWEKRMRRLVISILYGTGIRRAELIDLDVSSVDFARNVIHVLGKGDKMREIPIISSLSREIFLYLQATESMMGERTAEDPLLVTEKGRRLYLV